MLPQISKGMSGFENLVRIQGFFTDLPKENYQVTAVRNSLILDRNTFVSF